MHPASRLGRLVLVGILLGVGVLGYVVVHRRATLHAVTNRLPSRQRAVAAPPGFKKAVALSAGGGTHVCVILDGGSLWCWGDGDDGALGYGNANHVGDDETPGDVGPVNIGSGRTATAVSAGDHHTCAI